MDFWSKKQSRRLPVMTSGTLRKTQKNPNGTKPTLINMVKAVTTRSGTRKTPTIKETKKQPPLETNLNKDNIPRTEVSKDTTSNSCKDNPKDTSIKVHQELMRDGSSV